MTNYITCPYCGRETTARKARSHQQSCSQRPMSIQEVIDLALSITGTCDIAFAPDDWLEDYLISLAHRKGRETTRAAVQEAILEARQEYLRFVNAGIKL